MTLMEGTPVGNNRKLEEITIRNDGTVDVSLAGWRLEDESGRTWPLVGFGTLAPGQSLTIQRNGMPMSLDNSGDEIVLFDGENGEHDRYKYTSSAKGVPIPTGH